MIMKLEAHKEHRSYQKMFSMRFISFKATAMLIQKQLSWLVVFIHSFQYIRSFQDALGASYTLGTIVGPMILKSK